MTVGDELLCRQPRLDAIGTQPAIGRAGLDGTRRHGAPRRVVVLDLVGGDRRRPSGQPGGTGGDEGPLLLQQFHAGGAQVDGVHPPVNHLHIVLGHRAPFPQPDGYGTGGRDEHLVAVGHSA